MCCVPRTSLPFPRFGSQSCPSKPLESISPLHRGRTGMVERAMTAGQHRFEAVAGDHRLSVRVGWADPAIARQRLESIWRNDEGGMVCMAVC